MAIIKIVTDSTADIPTELVEKWDIHVVPLKVHIDQETFLDGVTIAPSTFFKKLENVKQFPSTSQPPPAEFEAKYREIRENHGPETQIISIHLSSALSGTYQSAHLAKTMLGLDVDVDVDVEVVDSKKASYMLGMIVVEAAKEAKRNDNNKEKCLALIQEMINEVKEFFVLDSLTYLQKGGRIGKAQAIVGTMLNVKPILSLNEQGEVYPYDKVRGKKKAVNTILTACRDYAGEEKAIASILYGLNRAEAEELKDRLLRELNIQDVVLAEIGPVIGAHVGPDALGIVIYKTL